jgi:hypothetical protein
MSNRDRLEGLRGVAIIVCGTAVLLGVFVFPILLGWPVGFGLYRYRAEVWAAIAQWVTVGIAAAAAVFALNQVQEARRTRERATQPNVVVFADLNPVDVAWLDVIIKNFGQTAAYQVRLHFDPWPTVMPWTHPQTGERVTRLLVPDIPVLAPGQEWRRQSGCRIRARGSFKSGRGNKRRLPSDDSRGSAFALRWARVLRGQ